jgi:hypothetical protein
MTETVSPNVSGHDNHHASEYLNDLPTRSGDVATALSPILNLNKPPKKHFSPYFASSIGPTERSVIPTGEYNDHDRVTKNFCTEVKATSDDVSGVFEQVEAYPLTEGARLNIGFITTLDALAQALESEDHWRWYIEGVSPLAGCGIGALEEMCIINIGRNDPKRPMDYLTYYTLLDEATDIYADRSKSRPVSTCPDGYEYKSFDRANAEIKDAVIEMLVHFEWDQDEAEAIVESNDVQFGLMIHSQTGKLASLIGLENRRLDLMIGGKEVSFDLQVVAEAITHNEHKGKGLYGYANSEIMKRNLSQGINPNVQVGEANLLPDLSIIKNAFNNQGRDCGLMQPAVRSRLGLEPSAQRAETTLNSPPSNDRDAEEKRALPSSFLITYLTRNMILERYGPKQI